MAVFLFKKHNFHTSILHKQCCSNYIYDTTLRASPRIKKASENPKPQLSDQFTKFGEIVVMCGCNILVRELA